MWSGDVTQKRTLYPLNLYLHWNGELCEVKIKIHYNTQNDEYNELFIIICCCCCCYFRLQKKEDDKSSLCSPLFTLYLESFVILVFFICMLL